MAMGRLGPIDPVNRTDQLMVNPPVSGAGPRQAPVAPNKSVLPWNQQGWNGSQQQQPQYNYGPTLWDIIAKYNQQYGNGGQVFKGGGLYPQLMNPQNTWYNQQYSRPMGLLFGAQGYGTPGNYSPMSLMQMFNPYGTASQGLQQNAGLYGYYPSYDRSLLPQGIGW